MDKLPIYDIWRLLSRARRKNEAEIRACCRTAYLGDNKALTRILGRYKLYVDTRDIGIASHLMMEGYWEMWVTEAMMQHVRRGSVVADIGANLGYFTLLMADLTGSDGRVLSFEPNPELSGLVKDSVEINGFAGFTDFYPAGLGSKQGWAEMDVRTDQPGGGRTLPIGDAPRAKSADAADASHEPMGVVETVKKLRNPAPLPQVTPAPAGGEDASLPPREGAVKILRFDELPHATEVEFMKIDVEGFEPHVWAGMTKRLENYDLPLTIFMEFTVGRFDNATQFLEEILSWGFSMGIITFSDGVQPIQAEELFARPHDIDHMLVFQRAAGKPGADERNGEDA